MTSHFQHIMPLEIPPENSKLQFKKKLYQANLAVYFETLAMNKATVFEYAEAIPIVAKLTEKKADLKSKFLMSLGNTSTAQSQEQINTENLGMTFLFDFKLGQVTDVIDCRVLSSAAENTPLDLSEIDKSLLKECIQTQLATFITLELAPTFLPFLDTALDLGEMGQAIKKKPRDGSMLPYSLSNASALRMEIVQDGVTYFVNDMYCVNPACDCLSVTCVVLKIDPQSQKEVLVSGFRFSLQNQKWSPLKDVNLKSNPAEWIKKFRQNCPIFFDDLLMARYDFARRG